MYRSPYENYVIQASIKIYRIPPQQTKKSPLFVFQLIRSRLAGVAVFVRFFFLFFFVTIVFDFIFGPFNFTSCTYILYHLNTKCKRISMKPSFPLLFFVRFFFPSTLVTTITKQNKTDKLNLVDKFLKRFFSYSKHDHVLCWCYRFH